MTDEKTPLPRGTTGPTTPEGKTKMALNPITHGGYSSRRPKGLGGKGRAKLDGRSRNARLFKRYRRGILDRLPDQRKILDRDRADILAFVRLNIQKIQDYALTQRQWVVKGKLLPCLGTQYLAWVNTYLRGMQQIGLDGLGAEGLDLTAEIRRLEAEERKG